MGPPSPSAPSARRRLGFGTEVDGQSDPMDDPEAGHDGNEGGPKGA